MHTHLRLWWIENTLYFTCGFKDFVQDIDYQVYRCHFLDYGLHYFDEESALYFSSSSPYDRCFLSDPVYLVLVCSWNCEVVGGFFLVYFSWFYWFVGWYFSSNLGNFSVVISSSVCVCFSCSSLPSLSGTSIVYILNCLILSHGSLGVFVGFFFKALFFSQLKFGLLLLDLSSSSHVISSVIQSAIRLIQWIFHFRLCVFSSTFSIRFLPLQFPFCWESLLHTQVFLLF